MTVLVTGANGFVGRALVGRLAQGGHSVRATVRQCSGQERQEDGVEWLAVDNVGPDTNWSSVLRDVDAVVHLVARTHVIGSHDDRSLALYRRINVEGTRRLAEHAAIAGVQRFVFVSSIKVNGERTFGRPFRSDDDPAPEDAYGISKREAEVALAAVATGSGMETVVVRPPLIYGPGVKGNFSRLMRLVAKGFPLPLGSVKNRRSMVALANIVDLLVRCVEEPKAGNRLFLVSDGESLSVPELIRSIAAAMGRRSRLLPAPPAALRLLGRIARRGREFERLIGSLEVDDTETRKLLDWQPPMPVGDAIRLTVEDFMRAQSREGELRREELT